MNDDQVAASSADHQLIGVGRDTTPHQARCVKHFLIDEALLGMRVYVPCEDAAVETGRHEKALLGRILDVLHPI